MIIKPKSPDKIAVYNVKSDTELILFKQSLITEFFSEN
ncbi:hypothetical protein HNQ88_004485 [Aureibacter tunicatorum]|uniref:Uncharacterized protein n=1 Tax=Aureibacter tunicatorum TaxID=866807 RepID=A0AAE3XRG7_9BACT|nr:hypothetical protein [Aureibacter tunicatorum]BDD06757.1 hypothetical protein AUTU_42400 [Aureibacter tunicatorum]